ncbi:MAG: hypothetical protein KDC38_07200 [Planctomycetes bacterium]|nr:hypothetical protein [Planctomycetota bacterium]
MHLAIDIDDTITVAPKFFAAITQRWTEARVTIVTFRVDRAKTEAFLENHGIRYDRLITSDDPVHGCPIERDMAEWKVEVYHAIAPDLIFEDMLEVVQKLDPSIPVLLPCDAVIRAWIGRSLSEHEL